MKPPLPDLPGRPQQLFLDQTPLGPFCLWQPLDQGTGWEVEVPKRGHPCLPLVSLSMLNCIKDPVGLRVCALPVSLSHLVWDGMSEAGVYREAAAEGVLGLESGWVTL